MFEIRIAVTNPFVTRNGYRELIESHGSFNAHKHWKIEALCNKGIILGFELETNLRGGDHAGPTLRIGLLCIELRMKMYDSRHWCYETNNWTEYDYS